MFPNLVIKVLDQFPKTPQEKETGGKCQNWKKHSANPKKGDRGRLIGLLS